MSVVIGVSVVKGGSYKTIGTQKREIMRECRNENEIIDNGRRINTCILLSSLVIGSQKSIVVPHKTAITVVTVTKYLHVVSATRLVPWVY